MSWSMIDRKVAGDAQRNSQRKSDKPRRYEAGGRKRDAFGDDESGQIQNLAYVSAGKRYDNLKK